MMRRLAADSKRARGPIAGLMSLVLLTAVAGRPSAAEELGRGEVYATTELSFRGPRMGPADTPARDVEFWVRFRHESGQPEYRVHGFWDGDGRGKPQGDVFKVR